MRAYQLKESIARVASIRENTNFFFFNDTATTEIYTLSLHDALPIFVERSLRDAALWDEVQDRLNDSARSEEHTSELQSRLHLVCRLLLEKKKLLATSRRFSCSVRSTSSMIYIRRFLLDRRFISLALR